MSRCQKIDMHVGPVLIEGRLERRNLCECGFPFFREGVNIGKPYRIDAKSVRWARFKCGGCGNVFPVLLVDVWDEYSVNWFPLECLDLFRAMKELPPLPQRWEPVFDNKVSSKLRRPGIVHAN